MNTKNKGEVFYLTVYENGTIYLNDVRIRGRKIYVSQNVKCKHYEIKIEDLKEAINNFKPR